jgi:ABC-2 type transport system permease protein
MVPGLLPIALILPTLAIALAITREKELGSFETLATTPIRAVEYLLGKLIPYIVFGLISASIAIALAIFWFGVPLRGGLIDLVVLTALYLFATLGETLLISSFLTSQGTAMRVILLIFFIPSFFMAGIILPIDTRSGAAQISSFLLPATQFVQATRGIFLKSMGIVELIVPVMFLSGLGLVPFLLSLRMFKKQVD